MIGLTESFKAAVEAAPCSILMVDETGAIVMANAETQRLFGWAPEELLGQAVELLVPERFRSTHVAQRDSYNAAPRPRPIVSGLDLYGRRRDGSEFPVEIGLSPVKTTAGSVVVAAITDVSADRQRAEELARSNRELEEFARVASHDLQEPLRAVAGCVQILQRRYSEQLDEQANELIEYAVDGANRMRSLIEDLLTYSQVGRSQNLITAVDCLAALENALQNLAVSIEQTRAEVTHGPLPAVAAVSNEVVMLFQNLVGNAIKFRRQDVPPRVEVLVEQSGADWLFSVRDNGIGIDPQFHDRIFVIFQRLHTRREYPGTGIGLALCKRIVEHYGGRIWVTSPPGEGAEFRFTLPQADTRPPAQRDG